MVFFNCRLFSFLCKFVLYILSLVIVLPCDFPEVDLLSGDSLTELEYAEDIVLFDRDVGKNTQSFEKL